MPENPVGGGDDSPKRPDPDEVVVLDELPHPIYAPKPEYPEIARQAGIEGTVMLKVLVTREGKVAEILMMKSSPVFDDEAQKAIRSWRFRPAILGGRTVPAWVVVPVRFLMR